MEILLETVQQIGMDILFETVQQIDMDIVDMDILFRISKADI